MEKKEDNTVSITLVLAFFIILACWNSCSSRNYNNGFHISDPEMNVIR